MHLLYIEKEVLSIRNYQKESAWERKTYKIFSFKARKDNGEAEMLEKSMGNKSFAEWVRDKLEKEKK